MSQKNSLSSVPVSTDASFFLSFKTLFDAKVKAKLISSDLLVFDYMCTNMTYNTNIITMSVDIKLALSTRIGLANPRTINNALQRLRKNGFIMYRSGSEYMVNPFLVWKGDKVFLKKAKKLLNERYEKNTEIKQMAQKMNTAQRKGFVVGGEIKSGRKKQNSTVSDAVSPQS